MDRSAWRSGKGEPFALAEMYLMLVTAAMMFGLAVYWMTEDVLIGTCAVFFAYMIMDRVRIIADWVRQARRARTAHRHAAPVPAPARAYMAVRPVG